MKGLVRKNFGLLFMAWTMVLLMSSCEKEKSSANPAVATKGEGSAITEFPREKTLYMAGFQWGEPKSFNPVADQPDFPVGGNYNLMYEPLLVYNSMTGKSEPQLGTLISQDADKITVAVQPKAKWSDGKPVTATDVKFVFELGKRFSTAPTAYVWKLISDITVDSIADSSGTITEHVNFIVNKKERNNPLVVMDLLQGIRIVPAHIFEKLLQDNKGDLSAVQKLKMDKNAVVSGAYTLLTYSNEKIVLERRDDYWGNEVLYGGRKPAPQYIVNPIYKSNDAFSIALQKGHLDISGTFIPRIWLKAKNGVGTWYPKAPYFIPSSIPMFTINHTKAPLNDVAFRRAMAFAINYKDVLELAVSGYSPEMQSGLVLPFGVEEKFFNREDNAKYGVKYDPKQAKKILAEAGYKSVWDGDNLQHMLNAKGEKLKTLFIMSPSGWSDWEAIVKIAVKGMRAVGIDVREGFVDAGQYWKSQPEGSFDLLMNTPSPSTSPSKPWSRFQSVMSSRNWKAVGEKMNENQGRYNQPGSTSYNPTVDSLLKVIPVLTNETEIAKAYRELNVIFMKEQVTLPVVYRPEQFYEYSTLHWTNFATAENPYAPPQLPCFSAGTKMLWKIKAVK